MASDTNYTPKKEKKDWLDRLTDFSEHYIPEAFPLVLILTTVVVVAALFLTESSPVAIIQYWYDGFWSMTTFSMQVVLLMFTGYLVAESMPVRRILIRIARIPKTTRQALLMFIVVMCVINYLHFAIAIAAAIMFGRALLVEQAKKGNKIPYSMFVAIGFFGLMLQGGPTAGSPLLVASSGHFMEDVIGVIPLTQSMLTLPMICMNLTIFAIIALVFPWLVPQKKYDIIPPVLLQKFEEDMSTDLKVAAITPTTFAERVDHSIIFQMLVGIVGLIVFAITIYQNGMNAFNLNAVNFLFLMLALVLHRSPANVIHSARNAITTVSNIVLQYPFYAGVFGILSFSGLGVVFTEWFVALSTPRFYTFIVFCFSALLNFIVPSGGTQFMVEAPYIMPAAIQMGVNPAYVLNAFTVGDLVSNLVQPFWALPVLTVFGLKFRNIFPYCLIAFFIGFSVESLYFLLWMH